ncbi:Alpha-L-arabinofuranosidase B (ABFB) domain protein [uncultured archaeon]|nr:Alpha-L-arabinofuranosidase B (ABFB) domain protein [uncultured archaeon]
MKTVALILLLAMQFLNDAIANAEYTGKAVSIQSYNYPGNYIRHAYGPGEITEISSNLDKQDPTFKIVPGFAGWDGNIVSFESLNYPGHPAPSCSTGKQTEKQMTALEK